MAVILAFGKMVPSLVVSVVGIIICSKARQEEGSSVLTTVSLVCCVIAIIMAIMSIMSLILAASLLGAIF